MELKKVEQEWNSFPETSMEERPLLSSDLEKIVLANPLSGAFYIKNKLLLRIYIGAALWLLNAWQVRGQWKTDGDDLYQHAALLILLSWFLYFQISLVLFADYPTLLSLPLVTFLNKLENVFEKYIISFKIVSILAGFYLFALLEWALSRVNIGAYDSISGNAYYKWLSIIFLSVSFYILLLQSVIPKYRRLAAVIAKYKQGITARSQKK